MSIERKPRVALLNPPAARIIYGQEYSLKSVTPCLGLFYLQSYCADLATVEVFEGEFYPSLSAMCDAVNEFQPDVLGITTNTSTFPLCIEAAQQISARLKLAGGPYSTFRVEESLEYFDAVTLGDGEVTLRRILEGTPLAQVPGIAYRDQDRKVCRTGMPELLELDSIPFPDRSKMQLGRYQASPHRALPEPFATMITSRGCGFACSFCLSARGGLNNGRYRERSVENVIQEVRLLQNDYGIRSIQFWDDTFTMRKARAERLTTALADMSIAYVCNTRTDKIDDSIAQMLSYSGCRAVFFGVESGDQEILDTDVRKGVRKEQVERAVAACRKAGMSSTASFIFGSINDTHETIEETITFALDLDADYVLFNIYTAHPGTAGYAQAHAAGIIDDYTVDLNRLKGEPVGVPTICQTLRREELQYLKAKAYVTYYERRPGPEFAEITSAYRAEADLLSAQADGEAGRPINRWGAVPM